jgi:membrane peptidoglycan carboxypeptidase
MKGKLKIVWILILAIPGFFILVQIFGFITARMQSPKIIENALKSKLMVLNTDSLSKDQINILLMVEDPAFYSHKGVDHKSSGAGRTTISQGLVKIFYFKKFKPGIAKIRQTLIARFIFDPLVSKDDQLSLFLNYVYLGNNDGKEIRGFEKASKIYFNKSFGELTKNEYLSLVAMPVNPILYGIKTNPENNEQRVRRIRKLLSGECMPLDWKDSDFRDCED